VLRYVQVLLGFYTETCTQSYVNFHMLSLQLKLFPHIPFMVTFHRRGSYPL